VEPTVKAFWLPKKGNSIEEYEDAFAYSKRHFAVSDGATESSFAERWAQSLVEKFINTPPAIFQDHGLSFQTWLTPLQEEWHRQIPWKRLPWFAEEKARTGAFATFLGIQFGEAAKRPFHIFDVFRKRRSPNVWQAFAIGDSCLFQVRCNQVLRAFPVEHVDQFRTRPTLISSNPGSNKPVWARLKTTEGDYQPGDVFFFMTDALSEWFMRRSNAQARPWNQLLDIRTETDFALFVSREREQNQLRNDDLTLVVCHWKGNEAS